MALCRPDAHVVQDVRGAALLAALLFVLAAPARSQALGRLRRWEAMLAGGEAAAAVEGDDLGAQRRRRHIAQPIVLVSADIDPAEMDPDLQGMEGALARQRHSAGVGLLGIGAVDVALVDRED